MSTPTVVIVGGGIGGLTAAVGLERAGCDVQVLERVPEISPTGAGILLHTNAMMALETLDLAREITAEGVSVGGGKITNVTGGLLTELDFTGPLLPVAIHRASLQRVLLEHAGHDRVRTGANVEGYRLEADRVVVRLESGDELGAEVVVGADGVHSTIRAQHLADGPPRYCGYTCWRGVTRQGDAFERGRVFEIWGEGKRFGGVHVDDRLYWFAPVNAPPGGVDPPGSSKSTLLELYASWPERVRTTIGSTPESAIIRSDIVDRPFLGNWGMGRMTLLGDAAHPMAPDMAQGAGQAIEDAVVLAQCIAVTDDPGAGLRRYERLRRARTRMWVGRSRGMGRLAQWESPTARWVRDSLLRMTPHSMMRWEMERTLRFKA